jgi:tetratricopeptide (TPR) repeat protein
MPEVRTVRLSFLLGLAGPSYAHLRAILTCALIFTAFASVAGRQSSHFDHERLTIATTDAPRSDLISAGERRRYAFFLRRNQRLHLTFDLGDAQTRVFVADPGGGTMRERIHRRRGPLDLSIIAESDGRHHVEIASLETDGPARILTLTTARVRLADARDRRDDAAEAAFSAAEMLCDQWRKEQFETALERYEFAARRWESLGRWDAAFHAWAGMAETHTIRGRRADALIAWRRGAQAARRARDAYAEAQALNGAGDAALFQGQRALAKRLFRDAFAKRFGLDAERQTALSAAFHANLAELASLKGDFAQTIDNLRRSRTLREEIGDRRGQAHALLNLAYVHTDQRRLQEAVAFAQDALKLWRTLQDKRGEALTLTAMGVMNGALGNKQKALDSHRDAQTLFNAIGDEQSEAVTLNGLGYAYLDINQLETARDKYLEARRINRRLGNRLFEASTCSQIGAVNLKLSKATSDPQLAAERREEARRAYQDCMTISESAGRTRLAVYGRMGVAEILTLSQKFSEAEAAYRAALALCLTIQDLYGQSLAWQGLGDAQTGRNDLRAAEISYQRALEISLRTKDSEREAAAVFALARLAVQDGRPDAALTGVERAIGIVEKLRDEVHSKNLRASYFASVQEYYRLAIAILMRLERARPGNDYAVRAFEMQERRRARSLIETLADAATESPHAAPPELLKREDDLRNAVDKLVNELRQARGPHREEIARELRRLKAEQEEATSDVERARRPAVAAVPAIPSLAEIQSDLLDSETVLLEYHLGEERSYLWAVARDSFAAYELPPRAALETAARSFYALVSDPHADQGEFRRRAVEVGRLALAPAAAHIAGKRLLVVAEGLLQQIPFDISPASDADDSDVNVGVCREAVVIPSAATLAWLRRRSPSAPSKDIAVLADPVFDDADPRIAAVETPPGTTRPSAAVETTSVSRFFDESAPNARIPRLPATLQEAKAIQALAAGRSALVATGFDANLEKARSPELGRYHIVHIATHGLIDNANPELSGLVLSLVNERGAPQSGFLNVGDVYQLNLSADLVVLSACRAGLGTELSGEGLIGLTRAFQSAGARSVLASLWKADDAATAELMKLFYEGVFNRQLSFSAAMRAAKEEIRRQPRWRAPYYWAGFVLHGEYHTAPFAPPPDWKRAAYWGAAGAVGLALASFVIVRRRRRPPKSLGDSAQNP